MADGIGTGLMIAVTVFGLCRVAYRFGFEDGTQQANLKNRAETAERIASGLPVKSGLVAKSPSTIEGEQG